MNKVKVESGEFMRKIAQAVDRALNAQPETPDNGFVLLIFPFDDLDRSAGGGFVNYISNSPREDVIVALKETMARLEGRAGNGGTA